MSYDLFMSQHINKIHQLEKNLKLKNNAEFRLRKIPKKSKPIWAYQI